MSWTSVKGTVRLLSNGQNCNLISWRTGRTANYSFNYARWQKEEVRFQLKTSLDERTDRLHLNVNILAQRGDFKMQRHLTPSAGSHIAFEYCPLYLVYVLIFQVQNLKCVLFTYYIISLVQCLVFSLQFDLLNWGPRTNSAYIMHLYAHQSLVINQYKHFWEIVNIAIPLNLMMEHYHLKYRQTMTCSLF